MTPLAATPFASHPLLSLVLEQIGKLIDGEPGLSKDGMERTCRQVLPMQGHDGLPVRLGLMPQKAVRTFDPHHPKAGTLQR